MSTNFFGGPGENGAEAGAGKNKHCKCLYLQEALGKYWRRREDSNLRSEF